MKNIFYISVFWQDSIKDKTTSVMFRVLAFADTFALLLGPFQDFVNRVANTGGIENVHNVVCKVYIKRILTDMKESISMGNIVLFLL